MTRFTLTLSAPSTDTPDAAVRRLRSFLKSALRGFGLNCVACRQIGPDAEPNAENALAGSPLTHDRASTGIGHPRKSRPYDERLIAQHAVTFGW